MKPMTFVLSDLLHCGLLVFHHSVLYLLCVVATMSEYFRRQFPPQNSVSQYAHFLDLPDDVLGYIMTDFLSISEVLSLRRTNKRLRDLSVTEVIDVDLTYVAMSGEKALAGVASCFPRLKSLTFDGRSQPDIPTDAGMANLVRKCVGIEVLLGGVWFRKLSDASLWQLSHNLSRLRSFSASDAPNITGAFVCLLLLPEVFSAPPELMHYCFFLHRLCLPYVRAFLGLRLVPFRSCPASNNEF